MKIFLEIIVNGTEPMFEGVTECLEVDYEVRKLVKQYSLLSKDDQKLVKEIINSLVEKIKPH